MVASALLDSGQASRARSILATYLAEKPDHLWALCLMARAHIILNEYSLALKCAEDAIGLAPNYALAWRLLSLAASGLGRHKHALSAASTAVELEPLTASGYHLLVECMLSMGRTGRRTRALVEKAIQLDPLDPTGQIVLGNLYLKKHRNRAAARAFGEALRLEPGNRLAAHNLGVASLRRGRVGESVNLLGGVLRDQPNWELASANIGEAFIQLFVLFFLVSGFSYLAAGGIDFAIHVHSKVIPPDLGDAPWLARSLLLTAMAAVTGIVILRFRHSVGGKALAITRFAFKENPRLVVWATPIAGTYLMQILGAVTGVGWSQGFYAAGLAFFGLNVLMLYIEGFINVATRLVGRAPPDTLD